MDSEIEINLALKAIVSIIETLGALVLERIVPRLITATKKFPPFFSTGRDWEETHYVILTLMKKAMFDHLT